MRTYIPFSIFLFLSNTIFNNAIAVEGYYKDVFVNQGVKLSGPSAMPAIGYLNLTEEWLSTENTTTQNEVMVENSNDYNGVLLYPDGEPRFRVMYTHGGSCGHASTLGDKGIQNVRDHYNHGGGQCGSCAGSYLLSSTISSGFNLWSGLLDKSIGYTGSVDGDIPDDSPLLLYYDFGGDKHISGISHYNGGCVIESSMPAGSEVLLIHDISSQSQLHGHPSCWGWKGADTTGRVIGICSHPEGVSSGEKRDYMAAVILHCIAGLAPPDIKGSLVKNQPRIMNKNTEDNDPAYTKIGDLQYHHFTVGLQSGANSMQVTLDGDDNYDMHLFVAKDTFAFTGSADYSDSGSGADKIIDIQSLPAGMWHVGVKCATTVTSEKKSWGYKYTSNLEVLNGVEYTIKATWDATNIYAISKDLFNSERLRVNIINQKVFIRVNSVKPYNLKIYDVRGRLCWEPNASCSTKLFTWQPKGAGMYVVRLESGKNIYTRRLTVVK